MTRPWNPCCCQPGGPPGGVLGKGTPGPSRRAGRVCGMAKLVADQAAGPQRAAPRLGHGPGEGGALPSSPRRVRDSRNTWEGTWGCGKKVLQVVTVLRRRLVVRSGWICGSL